MEVAAFKETLILCAFLLLVADRTLVLFFIRVKAKKTLKKSGGSGSRERRLLSCFLKEFTILQAVSLLACFATLCLMQVIQRDSLSNDVGRAIFAAIGFLLSIGGTLLNVCIERLELKQVEGNP
jgi:hypothetical protein